MDFAIALRDLTVTKKWIDQDSSRSSSVEIDLFNAEDGEAVTLKILDNDSAFSTYTFPKVKLSSENSWQSTWTGLDGRKDYWVKEVKIPTGYTIAYNVVNVKIIDPRSVYEVINSEYDLTLYTCTIGGASRVIVSCNRVTHLPVSGE